MDKVFCVISHTHWDREWYMPFEQFRLRLVDLMDNLLAVLEEYPEYIFHLDAQTVVLEDYLEIRPYRRDLLKRHIAEGRLLVGPWYVQNDFYLTSGEATVRNLIIGSRMAEVMGGCTRIGYTPDQFGLISQLPQIFRKFGMDSCIFGRGYAFCEKQGEELKWLPQPSELTWEGPDGSRVLGILMPFWYNNAQRFSEDMDKSMKLLASIERNFEGIALTPYLLLMNGVDHLEAQENLLPLLAEMNGRLPENKRIVQTTLPEYVAKVREYLKESVKPDALPLYRGEMRNGVDYSILQGTLSSRIYLKAANVKAQNLLENSLEPLYSMLSACGAGQLYPADYMTYLWKQLIRNHPHDSICGCSRDEVHDHMEDRYRRIHECGEMLLERGAEFLTAHITRTVMTKKDSLLAVINTLEFKRGAVIEAELQFPVEEAVQGFTLLDADGNPVPYAVLERKRKFRDLLSPINLPGFMEVDAYRIQVYREDIPAMGYKSLIVRPETGQQVLDAVEAPVDARYPANLLENEYLKVSVSPEGRVTLADKAAGTVYQDCLRLEDMGDRGDSYVYGKVEGDTVLTTDSVVPEMECLMQTPFETRVRLTYRWLLPTGFDYGSGARTVETVMNTVGMTLSLKKGSRRLEVDFDIDNRSRNHRLRALVATGLKTDLTQASAPFDIITRDRREVLKGVKNGTQPNSGFVDISEAGRGLAVLTEGEHEYEHLMDCDGTLAVTLLRATGRIEINSLSDQWQVPGNQCLRRIQLRMALYPHAGDCIEADVAAAVREFQNPALVCFQPYDIRKLSGGRPAVQDSEIKEIFFRKDPFVNVQLPPEASFLEVKGKGVLLSALKKAEDGKELIIRLINTLDECTEAAISLPGTVRKVRQADLKEDAAGEFPICDSKLRGICLQPKEILTLLASLE